MVGRASPARMRARAACISSRRSLASRMTSPRLRGDGSTGVVCAAAGLGEVMAHTVRRRANRRPVRLFMTITACFMPVRPDRRHAPARIAGSVLTEPLQQAACASPQPRSLLWPRPATARPDGRSARPPGRFACPGRLAPSRRARWRPRRTASPTSGSTPRGRGDRRACSPWPPAR